MGESIQLLQVERKICHLGTSTTLQYSSLTFVMVICEILAAKHNDLSQEQVEKHC